MRTSTFESEVRREQLLAQRLEHELNNALEHELVSTAEYLTGTSGSCVAAAVVSSAIRGAGGCVVRSCV